MNDTFSCSEERRRESVKSCNLPTRIFYFFVKSMNRRNDKKTTIESTMRGNIYTEMYRRIPLSLYLFKELTKKLNH